MNIVFKNILIAVIFLFSLPVFSQNADKIAFTAETQIGTEIEGKAITKLIGNVVLTQKQTIIHGDSAYFYRKENIAEVYGKVKILEGDSITVTGNKLYYDGNTKIAQMRGNVVYTDPKAILYTDFLDYNMNEKLAYYYNNGRLINEQNTLVSERGSYDTENKLSSFRNDVYVTTPDYDLRGDTLQYNTATKIAYVRGPTEVLKKADSTVLRTIEEGTYMLTEDKSNLIIGEIETKDYVIKGQKLTSDKVKGVYTATNDVVMVSKENNVIITGNFAISKQGVGVTKVYGNALMKKPFEDDTLYLSADTLVAIEADIEADKRLLAYNNVKIYKLDLQGKSDSLAYHVSDSIIYLYQDPVLWNTDNQIVADSIDIMIANNQIDKMNMIANAFVISQDTIKNFNQIKGRRMTAFFEDNEMSRVKVDGNSEGIYFVLEENDSVVMGMNKWMCSNMLIKFQEGKVNDIKLYVNPDASFIPPHEIQEPDKRLKNFNWREKERPSKDDVINHTQIISEEPQAKPKSEASATKSQRE